MLNGLSDNGDIKTYVDGEKVDNVLLTGVPIPHIDSKRATLVYYTMLENKGQQIVDIAAHTLKVILNGVVWCMCSLETTRVYAGKKRGMH